MLASLACVDYVVSFETRTPVPLIEQVRPAVYVKGGDYKIEDLPEAAVVFGYGGSVQILSLIAGRSTTNIIARVCAAYGSHDSL
jgi:bifunctional ADP-heptose synthase (sugar kinase/adenylyltransferase)